LRPNHLRLLGKTLKEPIDGCPLFAKHSIDDGKQVKIAAIDPGFD
jgi:hypothetical protein